MHAGEIILLGWPWIGWPATGIVMTEGMSIPVIPELFHFTYLILNPGASFGLLLNTSRLFLSQHNCEW